MSTPLSVLLEQAAAKVKAMTPAEREEMLRVQREGYVKAELSWPKPEVKTVDGVQVFASYEDYCNG